MSEIDINTIRERAIAIALTDDHPLCDTPIPTDAQIKLILEAMNHD